MVSSCRPQFLCYSHHDARSRQKRLSFRREPTPSQERECLEDVQKLLVDAEEKRTKTFHNSLRLLEFDFLQAESDRNFPEKTRQTDFSKTQSERREKFVADEADRLASFKDADAEQEKIFSISEERRLSTFNSVQSSRKTAMHQIVETQQIQNDWAITLVKTLYVEGHQSREALCKEALAAVSNDFASFLQASHSSFSATQSRRINAVKGTHPPSHTVSEDHEQPKLDVIITVYLHPFFCAYCTDRMDSSNSYVAHSVATQVIVPYVPRNIGVPLTPVEKALWQRCRGWLTC